MGVDYLREQAFDLRQPKRLFRKSIKLYLGQNLCRWCNALYGSTTSNKMMCPLLPLTFFIILDAVLQPLATVLVLSKLRLQLSFFCFELFNGFAYSDTSFEL